MIYPKKLKNWNLPKPTLEVHDHRSSPGCTLDDADARADRDVGDGKTNSSVSLGIYGIGCDIIEIERIKGSYEKLGASFLKRIFSEEEIDYCFSKKNPFPSLAARFAAKEAVAKALGTGIGVLFGWQDCSITLDELKKPKLTLSEKTLAHFGPLNSHISLSHTDEFAMAYVLLEIIR